MSECTVYPEVSGDDGSWKATSFQLDGGAIYFGNVDVNAYKSFIRFPSVNIPQGCAISSAILTLKANGINSNNTTCNVKIYGNAADNAVAPTSISGGDALDLTTANVEWSNIGAWNTAYEAHDAPDLKTIVQEIIDRAAWVENNALMLVIHDNGSSNDAHRPACSRDTGTSYRAKLVITYFGPELVEETLEIGDLSMSNAFDSINDSLVLAEILSEKYPIDVEDVLAMASLARLGYVYAVVSESFLDIVEVAPSCAYHHTIDESLVFECLADPGLYELIEEILTLTDTIRAPAFIVMEDAIFIYDNEKVGWHKLVPETFNISVDVGSGILALMISEFLTLTDTEHNNWSGQHILADTVGMYGLPKIILQSNQTIADTIAVADSPSWRLMLAILDVMSFTDLAKAVRKSQHTAAETLTLTDEAQRGFEVLAESILTSVDASAVIIAFAKSISESLVAADSPSVVAKVAALAADSLTVTDSVVSGAALYEIVRETLKLNVLLELDGETWECYVLNTPKFMPSMYSGYDFNSYCVFDGRAFGANDKGIYELTGDTDAGAKIRTGVILSKTDFGSHNQKRVRRGFFGVSGTSPVMILETDDGQRQVYSIDQTGKAVASHDLKSKGWVLSVADFETLDSITLIPVILTR